MKIAFIGNFEAEFSTENYHKKTFEKLGHTVIQIQENKTSVKDIWDKSVGCDMLYWTHTHSWRVGSGPDVELMLTALKERGTPTVGYHLDLWLGLQRERDLHIDPYYKFIEHFFTVDKLMADWLNQNTKVKGHFLPAGVFEDDCFLAEPNHEKYPHEIIFTGSKGYHHEYPFRHQLIDFLHKTYGDRFAHYGGGGLPSIRGQELNVLYASAKVVVGDTLCKNFNYPWYSSDRLFEAAGRGAFLVYPDIEGLETFYEHQKEVVFYKKGDLENLKNVIDYYLDMPITMNEIRKAAVERTKKEHTYTHRLQEVLNCIKP